MFASAATLRKTIPDARPSLYFTLFFWAFSYGVLTLRAGLAQPADLDLWSIKRGLATAIGAIVYLAILDQIIDSPALSRQRRLQTVFALTLPAAGVVLAVRLMFDLLAPDRVPALVADLRWILVWTGYFIAWIAAYVVHADQRRLLSLEAPGAVDSVVDDSIADDSGPTTRLDFWGRRDGATVYLPLAVIERFEAEGNYVRIHASDGATGFMRLSLRRLLAELDGDAFIRVHRSTICRKNAIATIKRHDNGGMSVVLESGTEIAVGRTFAKFLLTQWAPG
jgi:hypothetical protein